MSKIHFIIGKLMLVWYILNPLILMIAKIMSGKRNCRLISRFKGHGRIDQVMFGNQIINCVVDKIQIGTLIYVLYLFIIFVTLAYELINFEQRFISFMMYI